MDIRFVTIASILSFLVITTIGTTTGVPTILPTKNPTLHPTSFPTRNPTQGPTSYKGGTRLVKVKKGTQIQLRRGVLYDGTPTKLEVIQSGPYERVLWRNVEWSLYGTNQPQIAECDPVPNLIPGEWPNTNGVCPCLEVGCTTSPPVSGKFTTLRCCITAKEEFLVTGGSSLPAEVWVQNATVPSTQEIISYGTIRCNNAIERELNCQFWRQAPSTYQLQCSQSPIDCYRNQTLGYAFGLFWDRNPRFPYTEEPLGEGQLRGISSILNYKVYSRGGELADPLDPKLMNDYYWIGGFTPPEEEEWPFQRAVFMPDVIQMRPASWFLNLYTQDSVDPEACLLDTLSEECQWLTWQNLTGWPEFKLPGLWLELSTNLTVFPQEWIVRGPGEGVEVWQGEELLYQNLTRAGEWTVSLATQIQNLKFRILLGRGQTQVWDIPAAQLSPSWPIPPDPLWSQVQMGNLQLPLLQLVSLTQRTAVGDWPFLQNLTWLAPSLRLTYTLTPQRWDNLSRAILEENTYPFNTPLALQEHLYVTRAVNLTEDYDYLRLIWATHLARRHPSEDGDCRTFGLGGITFLTAQGEDLFTQSWYQSDPSVPPGIPEGAREGGCLCDALWDPLTSCAFCLEGLGGPSCEIVFGPDPVPGAPPGECSGHGRSQPSQTTENQTLLLWEGKFATCHTLTLQGSSFELVPEAGQGSAFLYQGSGGGEIVYLRGQLFFQLEPLETILVQERPPVWETPLGLVECLGIYKRPFLMNAPYELPPLKAQLAL